MKNSDVTRRGSEAAIPSADSERVAGILWFVELSVVSVDVRVAAAQFKSLRMFWRMTRRVLVSYAIIEVGLRLEEQLWLVARLWATIWAGWSELTARNGALLMCPSWIDTETESKREESSLWRVPVAMRSWALARRLEMLASSMPSSDLRRKKVSNE